MISKEYLKLKNLFSLIPKPLIAVVLLVVIGILAIEIFYNTTGNQTTAEREFAKINQSDLSNTSEFKSVFAVNLSSGAFRDSGSANKLSENRMTDAVLFRLALPFEANPADKFKVEILQDKKIILSGDETPFYNNSSGKELRLLVPSSVLKKGEYQVKIEREAANESAVNYNFTVQ